MRVLLVNPPHPAIGSRIPRENLPPLGLLMIGGSLIDAGHDVRLVDGEPGYRPLDWLVAEAVEHRPDAILIGHSGSTSAHPIIADLTRRLKAVLPLVTIIYGGVYPTYHWREVLRQEPQVDVIVRGEGEETIRLVARALECSWPLRTIPGIAFRHDGRPFATQPAAPIADLDKYRVGWELIDHRNYGYWGGKRAVVVQFSRGCPHLCNYCGQRGFWTRWRHRDPVKFAAEIARLHRDEGVEVFNFADENPTVSPKAWRAFLEAMIAENVKVTLVASTRAGDIVRDADILHLYKQAGFERFLMGMENTDQATLDFVQKGASIREDREAVRLLRKHNIISLATWVVGFADETDASMWRTLKNLIATDPDQITTMYVTPHRWTPFYRLAKDRRVIDLDQRNWDYRHQVLETRIAPWRLLLWVKVIEAALQLRPKAVSRYLWNPEPKMRHAMRWYYRMGKRVWKHELLAFLFRDRRLSDGPTLAAFWGAPQDGEEEALGVGRGVLTADGGGHKRRATPHSGGVTIMKRPEKASERRERHSG